MASGVPAATTEMLIIAFAVCAGEPVSVTMALNEELPLAVGVPEIPPVAARVSPAGSAPDKIDQVYVPVPPKACRAAE